MQLNGVSFLQTPGKEFWGQLLSLEVSGFSPFPRQLGIWKKLETGVTDQPFSNIPSQA